jgi:hypothetical protein
VDFRQGSFYLGGPEPPGGSPPEPVAGQFVRDAANTTPSLELYDARDLVTHGVIVGMTGSGKTGLAVDLLEEALLSGVPSLILDPKGDLTNLLLNFPELRPEDFRPWVNEGDARRKGRTVEEFAADTAEVWRTGLASWGLGTDRMRDLARAARFVVYTPGSRAGVPLNVMGSLSPPPLSWDTDPETLRDEIQGFVSSLLAMAGIEADPIASREHVLLSNLVEDAWRAGRALDLATLITAVQDPPIRKLGVFEVDAFFPPKDRTALAMRLNGLVASPSFAGWLEGAPLDVASLLHTADGTPRASILYLAHLSDEERQFVVTLLLSKVVTWMRGLPGTTDLRALVYMDEVFGFAPPTANPPSKRPILTILKQARAFGVGLVLATQNPVDLDYKAMSNAGTWFVGRLQTERDKARILEALQAAGGEADLAELDRMISGLEQRRFLLHNTHGAPPRTFQSRWAMSYLRGPLTREQIQVLMADAPERAVDRPAEPADAPATSASVQGAATPAVPVPARPDAPAAVASSVGERAGASTAVDGPRAGAELTPVAPLVAPGTRVAYLDPAATWAGAVGAVPGGAVLRAALAARVHLRYDDVAAKVDATEEWEAVFFPLAARFDPAGARLVDYDDRDLRPDPPGGGAYELPAAPVGEPRFFREAASALKAHLVRTRPLALFVNRSLRITSRVGEVPEAFAIRCDTVAQTEADRESAKIRDRLEAKKGRVADALDVAEREQERLEAEAQARGQEEVVSGAGSLLSIFLGGRGSTRTLAGAAAGRSTTQRAQARVQAAHDKAEARYRDLQELEEQLAGELQEIDARWREKAAQVETVEVGLESADVQVDELAVVWIPTA